MIRHAEDKFIQTTKHTRAYNSPVASVAFQHAPFGCIRVSAQTVRVRSTSMPKVSNQREPSERMSQSIVSYLIGD
jgi:hypothetical protein